MRIGIMTYWQTLDNYGQVLQAYALQCVLRSMGHEPFIIRYRYKGKPSHFSIKEIAKIVLCPIYRIILRRRRKRIDRRGFDDFRKHYMFFSRRIYNGLSELRKYPPKAECYIAGSDQVWSGLLSITENESYFLSFGGKNKRRVSYAASFGVSSEYPKNLMKKLEKELRAFDFISCREYSGVEICKKVGADAVKVLDPTLIAPISVYNKLITSSPTYDMYVYIYSINVGCPEQIRWHELRQMIDRKGYVPLVTTATGYAVMPARELYPDVNYSYASVPQWITNISHATLVVTTSFHGIVFSIIFHRPFVFVPLKGKYAKGNGRIFDLLNDLGLNSRILTDDTSYDMICNNNISWDDVDNKLKPQIAASTGFLEKALKTK